ncbi:MAG: T9SS type A sorting domain-containing protein [Bacteroidales bacterium]
MNSGMNSGNGTSIGYLFHNPNKYIYAFGWGFYRSIIPVLTTVENNLSPVLIKSMNIPNPFKIETLIKWDNSNIEELVCIIVISSSGEIIVRDKISNTGSYLFHADHLMPGIYYYSVIANNNIYSGKMVLIK